MARRSSELTKAKKRAAKLFNEFAAAKPRPGFEDVVDTSRSETRENFDKLIQLVTDNGSCDEEIAKAVNALCDIMAITFKIGRMHGKYACREEMIERYQALRAGMQSIGKTKH